MWFTEWRRGGTLIEESRNLPKWDQCLTLIWFDDDEVPPPTDFDGDDGSDEPLLENSTTSFRGLANAGGSK